MPLSSSTARRRRRVAAGALVVYWLALLTATHWPHKFPAEAKPFLSPDKLLHFSAYAGLAFIMAMLFGLRRAERGLRPAGSWLKALGVCLIVSAAGLFDEITQPLMNRDFEWYDWFADTAGSLLGVTVASAVLGTSVIHAATLVRRRNAQQAARQIPGQHENDERSDDSRNGSRPPRARQPR